MKDYTVKIREVKLLTTKETATICKVSPQTVLRWIHGGKLEAVRLGHKSYRVPESSLSALLRRETYEPGIHPALVPSPARSQLPGILTLLGAESATQRATESGGG